MAPRSPCIRPLVRMSLRCVARPAAPALEPARAFGGTVCSKTAPSPAIGETVLDFSLLQALVPQLTATREPARKDVCSGMGSLESRRVARQTLKRSLCLSYLHLQGTEKQPYHLGCWSENLAVGMVRMALHFPSRLQHHVRYSYRRQHTNAAESTPATDTVAAELILEGLQREGRKALGVERANNSQRQAAISPIRLCLSDSNKSPGSRGGKFSDQLESNSSVDGSAATVRQRRAGKRPITMRNESLITGLRRTISVTIPHGNAPSEQQALEPAFLQCGSVSATAKSSAEVVQALESTINGNAPNTSQKRKKKLKKKETKMPVLPAEERPRSRVRQSAKEGSVVQEIVLSTKEKRRKTEWTCKSLTSADKKDRAKGPVINHIQLSWIGSVLNNVKELHCQGNDSPSGVSRFLNLREGDFGGQVKSNEVSELENSPSLSHANNISDIENLDAQLENRLVQSLEKQLLPWHGKLQSIHIRYLLKGNTDVHLTQALFRWAKSQDGFKPDSFLYTHMIHIARKANNLETVEEIWKEMRNTGCKPTQWTLTAIARTYMAFDQLDKALTIVREALDDGLLFDNSLIGELMEQLGHADRAMDGLLLLKQFEEHGGKPESRVYNTKITLYGMQGDFGGARRVLKEIRETGERPDRFAYTRLISQFCRRNEIKHAKKVLQQMIAAGVEPDVRSFNPLMAAYSRMGLEDEALAVLTRMDELGIAPITSSFNTLLDMHAHARNWEKAEEVFCMMESRGLCPDAVTYNIMLHAHLSGSKEKAKVMLKRLKALGGGLDLRTYIMVLQGCFESDAKEDLESSFDMLEELNHPMHEMLRTIFKKFPNGGEDSMWLEVQQYIARLRGEALDVQQGFVNGAMQCLCKAGLELRAATFLNISRKEGIFPEPKLLGSTLSVDLHDMGPVMAMIATRLELMRLYDMAMDDVALPAEVGLITGRGKGSSLSDGPVVRKAVTDLLQQLDSPFKLSFRNQGRIFARGSWLRGWLLTTGKGEQIALKDRES